MKILIAYTTKTGTAREGAELLASLLTNNEVTVCDLALDSPDPSGFDYVVLGCPVRMAKADKVMRAYLKKWAETIEKIPHALFLCCAVADQFENYLDFIFPKALLESAEHKCYFGGTLDLSRQKGLDKLLVRMMRNAVRESEDSDAALPGFLPEHVRLLGDALRQKN